MSGTHEQNIGKHSKVTLAILASAIGMTIIGSAEWMNLKSDVRQIAHDQWTITEQLRWTSEMQKLNPALNVPIPTMPAVANNESKTNAMMASAIAK